MYDVLVRSLQTLAGVCDGAKSEDGIGFNGRDTGFGKSLANQSLTRELSPAQQMAAIKMLQTYRGQLQRSGIVLPTVTEFVSNNRPASEKPVTTVTSVTNKPVTRVTVSAANGQFILKFNYDPKLVEAVKALPRRKFNMEDKTWCVPGDMQSDLMTLTAGYETVWDTNAQQLIQEVNKVRVASTKSDEDISIPNITGELMPFQKAGVAFIDAAGGRAIIGDDMGLGKTIQAIGYLALHPELRPAVVVVPASLKPNWRREIAKWLTANNITAIIKGRKSYDVPGAHIYIVNYDIAKDWVKWLSALHPAVLICDEAHRIKSPKAQCTKAVQAIAKASERVVLMTGTPIMNRPEELFPLLQTVRPEQWLNFMPYAKRYCNARQVRRPVYNPKTKKKEMRLVWDYTGASNLPELHDKLHTTMIRRLKSEVLPDLPEKRRVVVPIEIDMKQYNRFMATTFDELKEAGNQAAQMVIIEKAKQYVVEAKMPNVFEWIDNFLESGEKIILFAVHKATVAALMERYQDQAVKITGDSNQQEREDAVQRFQHDDGTRIFVGNIQAAGVGLTLTAASNVAFIELAWRPGDQTQAEDRAHRIGQKNAVTAWYLLAEDTVDEDIFAVLEKKRQTTEIVSDGKVSAMGFTDNTDVTKDLIELLMKQAKQGKQKALPLTV